MTISEEALEDHIEEENYFVSMTDMMVGLVFIFIILLMYFAVQLRQTTSQLTSADVTRQMILVDIRDRLQKRGLKVDIDTQHGVLRLPDEVLFDPARAEIKPEGREALTKLSTVLMEVLPCYTDGTATRIDCKPAEHKIESLYIEGHTDKDAMAGQGPIRDNWDLSVQRATNTYRTLISLRQDLTALCLKREGDCAPILSVSGYGPDRPVARGDDAASKARNRRIDLRVLMEAPRAEEVQAALNARLGGP
jgi:flagellar motor protein MotB